MKSKRTNRLDTWQMRALLFIVFACLSYAFISLALDSAKTLEYVAGIVFLIWAIKSLIKAVSLGVNRG